jgi:hypothetical protein
VSDERIDEFEVGEVFLNLLRRINPSVWVVWPVGARVGEIVNLKVMEKAFAFRDFQALPQDPGAWRSSRVRRSG